MTDAQPQNDTEMTKTELAIGEVSTSTGVKISVLRYYDELGLIEPTRRVGGKRRFDTDVIHRVIFIRRAQEAGFCLDVIKDLLDDQKRSWPGVVSRHLDDLRERRSQLDLIIATLEEAQRCGCDVVAQCARFTTC